MVCVAEQLVNVTIDGPVAVVEMAAGKANALDTLLCRQIAVRFAELARYDVRSVVLTGAGPMFSAGVDLFKIADGGSAYVDEFLPALHDSSVHRAFVPSP